MKKALASLLLLSIVTFSVSCIAEIHYTVKINGKDCSWEDPVKEARRGHDYIVIIKPNDGYELYIDEVNKYLTIETDNAGDITYALNENAYDQSTSTLTIPGSFVTSNITITANAHKKDEL